MEQQDKLIKEIQQSNLIHKGQLSNRKYQDEDDGEFDDIDEGSVIDLSG